MALPARKKQPEKRGGRRRNYEAKVVETGIQTWIPRGWSNWTGTIMFAVITVLVVIEFFDALADGRGADPAAAALLAVMLGTIAALFARNRVFD